MPYVHLSIAKKLTDDEKEAIKSSVGKLIEILPGKTESVLMVRLDDDLQMYFRGEKSNCAYVNVCLYLMSPADKKGEFARALVRSISELAGLDINDIFLCFTEFSNWASWGDFH